MVTTILIRQVRHWHSTGLIGQLVRFGIAGGLASLIYSLVYLPLTHFAFPGSRAVFAVPFAFAVAVTFGFFAHSRWSFRDEGRRDGGVVQQAKFVAVQSLGLGVNAVITWFGTAILGYAPWVPLLPAILIAAALGFVLNRLWVFA